MALRYRSYVIDRSFVADYNTHYVECMFDS